MRTGVRTALVVAGLSGAVWVSSTHAIAQDPVAPDPQAPRPTFQSNIDLTLVDLRVVDPDGRFVRGLTRDDFTIFEDGKEQPISTFSLVDIPIVTGANSRAATRTSRVPPDVVSNAGADEGRLYLIVLGMGSRVQAPTYRALVREFVENHLSVADQVALVDLAGRRDLSQEFSRDTTRLLELLDRVNPEYGEPGDVPRTMTSIVTWLGQIQGRRKAIVFITPSAEVFVAPEPSQDGAPPMPNSELSFLLSAAAHGNVSLYIIDPTGVPTGKANGIKPVPLGDAGRGDVVIGDPGVPTLGTASTLSNSEMVRQGLRDLAEATGGLAFGTTSNDFVGAFDRIVEENSSYYLIGYASTNEPDRKSHKIKIEVKGPRLKVRARTQVAGQGLTAKTPPNRDGLSPDLVSLLKSPISVPGLTLNASAVSFKSARPGMSTLAVIVEARGRDLLFSQGDEQFKGAMEIAVVAADQDGRTQAGERGSLSMRLGSETYDRVATHGLRILSNLELKPGRYHLKVAATDAGGGQTRGVVQSDIVVPDFSKPPLSLSGVTLSADGESETVTNGSGDRWKPVGIAPTTVRAFDEGDELKVYFEAYDSLGPTGGPTNVVTTVKTAEGRTVFTHRQTLQRSTTLVAQAMVIPIALKGLAPGEYVLGIEARNTRIPDRPAIQQVAFQVTTTEQRR